VGGCGSRSAQSVVAAIVIIIDRAIDRLWLEQGSSTSGTRSSRGSATHEASSGCRCSAVVATIAVAITITVLLLIV